MKTMILSDEFINSLPTITEEQEANEFWNPDEFVEIGMKEYDKTMNRILESL